MQADPTIEIETALNGQLAIDLILADPNPSSFDIIFTDLHMPVLDGYQVRHDLLITNPLFQTAKELRRLASEGTINLENSIVLALSAIAPREFKNDFYQDRPLFDLFSKQAQHSFLLPNLSVVEKPISYTELKTLLLRPSTMLGQ